MEEKTIIKTTSYSLSYVGEGYLNREGLITPYPVTLPEDLNIKEFLKKASKLNPGNILFQPTKVYEK